MQARVIGPLTVVLTTIPALGAVVADIQQWFNPNAIADLPRVVAFCTHLDNHAGTLVASTLNAKFRHLWHRPVVQHVVDVGLAQASDVEPDEKFIVLWFLLGSTQTQDWRAYWALVHRVS